MTEHGRYDLVLEIADRLLRVQCKWARKVGDAAIIGLATSRRGSDGYVRSTYSPAEIDAVGAYCGDTDECFLLPVDLIAGRRAIQLRLAPARNGQRAALNFAGEYRLGAVAQLAERRRGTAEVRGSNPLSSIFSQTGEAPATEEVGAHRFRNHFGYYLDRAFAGTEVLVRRHGQPYASLCPPGRRRRLSLRRSTSSES